MNKNNDIASLRGGTQPRDHTAHRRVHLDTYARRRSGSTLPVVQSTEEPVVQQAQTLSSEQFTSTKSVTAPVQQAATPAVQSDYIRIQPPVSATSYQPAIVTPSQTVRTQQLQTVSEPVVSSQRKYLDTLTQRHAQAVANAPAAVETVTTPVISSETDTLFEDPLQDEKIAANLSALYSDSLTSMISADTKSASAAHVRTIVASAFACGIMAVGMFTFMGNYSTQPVVAQPIGAPVIEVEASAATPKEAPAVAENSNSRDAVNPDQPVRVVISSIGVNAPVEGLGTTPEGLIAVPKAYGVVGWYNKGVLPGKPGPAVLVGHYAGGNKAVFDNLQDLKDGDLITTTNGKGQSFTYRVTAKNEYEKDKVPMAQIFKKSSESRLEIITCSGKWQSNTYDKRLVVTAELVK